MAGPGSYGGRHSTVVAYTGYKMQLYNIKQYLILVIVINLCCDLNDKPLDNKDIYKNYSEFYT